MRAGTASLPCTGRKGNQGLELSKEGILEKERQFPIGSFDMIWSVEPSGSQWLAQDTGILAVVTVVDIPADMRAQ